MDALATVDLRTFVPAKDFATSKAFYAALGFTLSWESSDMVEFTIGDRRFFLQNYYQEAWAHNCMMNLVVRDVAAWAAHIGTLGLVEKFPGTKVTDPKAGEHGIILHLIDPSGVLWHIQERPEAR